MNPPVEDHVLRCEYESRRRYHEAVNHSRDGNVRLARALFRDVSRSLSAFLTVWEDVMDPCHTQWFADFMVIADAAAHDANVAVTQRERK